MCYAEYSSQSECCEVFTLGTIQIDRRSRGPEYNNGETLRSRSLIYEFDYEMIVYSLLNGFNNFSQNYSLLLFNNLCSMSASIANECRRFISHCHNFSIFIIVFSVYFK